MERLAILVRKGRPVRPDRLASPALLVLLVQSESRERQGLRGMQEQQERPVIRVRLEFRGLQVQPELTV